MPRYLLGLVVAAMAVGLLATHDVGAEEFSAHLTGFQEVGALNAETGAVFSPGTGTLTLDLDRDASTLTYDLTYSSLNAPVTQAHIHFGKIHVPGGIIVFLCSNLGNGPAGTPACPATGGTVTGTLTPASVVGPAAQAITPGNFDALVVALTSDTAYGNIHTTRFPAGEIRGQVRRGNRDDQRGEDEQQGRNDEQGTE